MKKFISVILAFGMLITFLPFNNIFAGAVSSDYGCSTYDNSYKDYLKKYSSYKNANEDIKIDFENDRFVLKEEQTQSFNVNVSSNCFYALKFDYIPMDNYNTDIEISVKINGEAPFDGFENIILKRNWTEDKADGGYSADSSGNEIASSLISVKSPVSSYLCDTAGTYTTPYLIALNSGDNSIELTSERSSIQILTACFSAPESEIPDYEEYLEKNKGKDYTGKTIIAEGESADLRSDSNLLSQSDLSSPSTSPSSPYIRKINSVGGNIWKTPGMWLEWNVNCKDSGYYIFGIKYRQSYNSGMFSTRTLYVNGEIPFKEAANIKFEYSKKWQSLYLKSKDGLPLKIYLKSGLNKIRLEVSLGNAAMLYQNGKASVDNLNFAYRQIIMLTGVNPDPLRNYRVDKNCPEAVKIFKDEISRLSDLSNDIVTVSGSKGTVNTSIDNLKYQLESFLESPISIPKRIETFRTNITAFADAVYSLKESPLEIDYLAFCSAENDKKLKNINSSVFEKIKYTVLSFVSSFSDDYILEDNGADDTVSVWVTTGRDQATVIKQLSDSDFTEKTKIKTDIKMVSSATGVSTLLLATVSGLGPDVAVGLPNSEAVNYAIRKSAEDVSKYPDFESVKTRFNQSALKPLEYDGGFYALPLTQSVLEMFCRDDILNDLGITVPKTLNGLYRTIGELQKKNITVGIPADLTYLSTLIFQNGKELYSADKRKSLFNESVAMREFSKLCELYTSYNIPIDYDAANRFRTGEMPIVIADYAFYNTVSVLAPEIKGNWSFYNIPGTVLENGQINNVSASTGSCAVILSSSKRKENAWKFISWLTDDSTQSNFANLLESRLGVAGRWQTANVNALRNIAWTAKEYETIKAQQTNSKGIEEIPGSYYVARNINNAIRNVVSYNNDAREILNDYTIQINDEITNKRKQYNLD